MSLIASACLSRFAPQDIGIDLQQVNISVNGRDLLTDSSVKLNSGVHYGLLGRNGVGKSTLLSCLANGSLFSINLREKLKVMFINQTVGLDEIGTDPERTVLNEFHKSPYPKTLNLSEKKKLEITSELQSGARGFKARQKLLEMEKLSVTDDFETQELDYDEEKIDMAYLNQILDSLKISNDILENRYHSLSGGWKMKVILAKVLLYEPDLLLLDEPTNHLDIDGIFWLQKTLKNSFSHMTILMVSHNRSFLDEVVERIIIFKNKALEYYTGNYSQVMDIIEEKMQFTEKYKNALEKKKAAMAASIRKNISDASRRGDDKKLKQMATKKNKLEERMGFQRNSKGHRFKLNRDRPGYHLAMMDDVPTIEDELSAVQLQFAILDPDLTRIYGPLLTAENLTFERKIGNAVFSLKDINFSIEAGEKIALLGPNGQGKSTLLNLLSGNLTPKSGIIQLKVNNIGYFQQNVVETLGKVDETPIERMSQLFPTVNQKELWSHLGSFGLGSAKICSQTPLKRLSGGQRVAFAFAEIGFKCPSLLFLDEPNSHLDLDALKSLSDSLYNYSGAIVFVSHDLSFVEEVATKMFWISDAIMEEMVDGIAEVESRLRKKRNTKKKT